MSSLNGPHSLLAEVADAIKTSWSAVPGRQGHALPTSESAILAVETRLGEVRQRWEEEPALRGDDREQQADVLLELEQVGSLCRKAREVAFSGHYSAVLGACFYVLLFVYFASVREDFATMAGALIWTVSVPLYLRAAVAPRYLHYRRVLSGQPSYDRRFLNWLGTWPKPLAPIGLLFRVGVYGAMAPALVLIEARRSGKVGVGLVMLGVITALGYGLRTGGHLGSL